MGQTLTHGIYLPDEGERNCYAGLASNWSLLDGAVGTIAEHTSQIAGKAPAVHTHTKADITDFPAYGNAAGTICEGNDSRLSDARTPVAHTHTKSDVTDLFNSANTWTNVQTFSNANNPIQMQSTIEEMGITPTANQSSWLAMMDKNGIQIGFISRDMYASGACSVRINVTDKYDSNGHSSSGANKDCTLALSIDENGNSFLQWSGEILRNSIIPYSTDTYLLGNATKQWHAVFAQSYYYNGVAWGLDKDNVWTGANSFYKSIQIHGARNAYIMPEFAASYSGLAFGTVEFKQPFKFGDWADNNSTIGINTSNAYVEIYAGLDSSDSVNKARLNPVNTTVAELGTSTNKWKTLNGVNPGALSLPDYNNCIDVTSNIPVASLDGSTQINLNDYLADKTGWLSIVIADTAGNSITVTQGKAGGATTFNNSRSFHTGAQSNGYISVFFPIIAGLSKPAFIKASSLIQMRFYYCIGNV